MRASYGGIGLSDIDEMTLDELAEHWREAQHFRKKQ